MIGANVSESCNNRNLKNSRARRTINITKLARAIVRSKYEGNIAKGYVDRVIKDDPEITTKFVLVNEGVDNTRKELSVFDSIVIDVASMLVSEDKRDISLQDLFKIIFAGCDSTEQRLKQLEESMDRIINTYITIYCREEFLMRRDVIDRPETITGKLLPMQKKLYGIETRYLVANPSSQRLVLPLQDYARITGQIATIREECFWIPSGYFSHTPEAICISTLVIVRIEQIIRGHTAHSIALFWNDDSSKGLIARLGYKLIDQADQGKGYEWSGGPCAGCVDANQHSNWCRKKGYIKSVVAGTLQHLKDIGVIKGYIESRRAGSKEVIGYDINY